MEPSSTKGERKQVTILFADLGGSFNAIRGVDPEEAEALLDAVVSVMREGVEQYDGTVNQVLGDGIMAVFGAPVSHEDHAVRAACAALSMQDKLKRRADPSWNARGLSPEIRVGLNSGEVVVRSVRNAMTIEYRAVGSTTHLAARMEQMAERGSILATDSVMRLGRGMLRARPLGPLQVRGLPEPVEVFALTGVATRTRFQATISRGLTRLVGRDEALEDLTKKVDIVVGGRSSAVLVLGEPGIGKSRLCHELLRDARASTCRVIEAAALSYARTTPGALMAGLLKSLLEIEDEDDAQETERKARAKLTSLAFEGDVALHVALELLGVMRPDDSWPDLDPIQRMQRIEQTVREILERACDEGPCVLLLEDLHWADPQSMDFADRLFRSPPGRRTLVLGTSRHAPAHPLMASPEVKVCALQPLSTQDSAALMNALLGDDPSLRDFRRRLTERTTGNPFFLEESVRAYVEMGMLEGPPGAHVLRKGANDAFVPATIEALIAARLDQIEPGALGLLQAAAVLGDDSSVEALLLLAGVPKEIFDSQFAVLTSADLLYKTGAFRAPLLRFRHTLIRDVTYGRMLRARRRQLHARALATLETSYPARLAEHLDRLAEHAHHAEQWIKSAHYHQLACVRAANRWANAQALNHLDLGLADLSRAEPSAERERLAIDLRLVALAPLLPVGDHERIISLLREAETSARTLGDSHYLAKIYSQLGTTLWLRGRHDDAMDVATRASNLARELEHFPLSMATRFNLALIQHARGQLTTAASSLRSLIADLHGPIVKRRLGWAGYPSVFARAFVISCDGLLGRFDEADQMYAEGRPVADELDHPYSLTMILEEYAFCQLVRGEAENARELLELAMRICQENEVVVMRAPIAARLGIALVDSGRLAEGAALIEDALARETYRTAGHYAHGYLLLALSDAQVRGGEPSLALATAMQAEEISRMTGERAYHVCALIQLAAVLAFQREHEKALDTFEAALERARELEMAPSEAFALQGVATVLADRGEPASASHKLEAAASIWLRVNAPVRLRQVRAQNEALVLAG